MLNNSIPLLRGKNKTLENMTYRDAQAAKIMRDILFRTDFWGMSVCIVEFVYLHCSGLRAGSFVWILREYLVRAASIINWDTSCKLCCFQLVIINKALYLYVTRETLHVSQHALRPNCLILHRSPHQ